MYTHFSMYLLIPESIYSIYPSNTPSRSVCIMKLYKHIYTPHISYVGYSAHNNGAIYARIHRNAARSSCEMHQLVASWCAREYVHVLRELCLCFFNEESHHPECRCIMLCIVYNNMYSVCARRLESLAQGASLVIQLLFLVPVIRCLQEWFRARKNTQIAWDEKFSGFEC